jgi:hypothetical protein
MCNFFLLVSEKEGPVLKYIEEFGEGLTKSVQPVNAAECRSPLSSAGRRVC